MINADIVDNWFFFNCHTTRFCKRLTLFLFSLVIVCSVPIFVEADETGIPAESSLTLVTWNIESGGNDPKVIARQLMRFRDFDIIALQEVGDENAAFYAEAFGPEYDYVLSATGKRSNDHLLVIYNTNTLTLRDHFELHEFKGLALTPNVTGGGLRSPLILSFTFDHLPEEGPLDKGDSNFICINVHLARSDAAQRRLQAFALREWIVSREEPVLALGDFNFDYNYREEEPGNKAFKIFTFKGEDGSDSSGKSIQWIRPDVLLDTNYSESRGRETHPHSILDFIFAANGAAEWNITSHIIKWDGDFPDTRQTSDHRPVAGIVRW